ncbi:MAG: 2-hydroxychromene-2-carboxylate isomerase [Myxococcota bacterium]
MTIEFFFEISSPYSYLAAFKIEELARRVGAEITWKPFVLGAVFKHIGSGPPAAIPQKGVYMMQDLRRFARRDARPFTMPPVFPVHSIKAHRAILASRKLRDEATMVRVTKGLYEAYWAQGKDISDMEVLGEALAGMGLDAEAVEEAMKSQEVKDELRQYTDEACARGVFGAPTFFLGDQMFWGNDRMDFLEQAILEST